MGEMPGRGYQGRGEGLSGRWMGDEGEKVYRRRGCQGEGRARVIFEY